MPKIFQFYVRHVALGFGAAGVFVGLILYFNVANLWHLISTSDIGVMALLVFWVLNGIVFAAVQFGVAVMMMAQSDDGPKGGGTAPEGLVPVAQESRG